MHLVKGNAGLLDLKFFEKKAHKFEDSIAELLRMPEIKGSSFISLVIQLEDLRNTMKEISVLIDKLGTIHNQFRPKREFENKVFVQSLNNLVTNLSNDYNKQISLQTDKFDPGILPYKLRLSAKDILVQLIRNSVYHGIETPEIRELKGKPATGTISINSRLVNNWVEIKVRDDGRGLHLEKLRESARKLNLWDPGEIDSWDKNQIAESIFTSGITTAEAADLIAGRGIGMDAIREKLTLIKGTIKVEFEENEYCEFTIKIPSEKRNTKAEAIIAEYSESEIHQ